MIEVFKTSVMSRDEAERIMEILEKKLPGAKINFDLDDCDNILRVESLTIDIECIRNVLTDRDHICELLE